jgi:hypothetical protein
LGEGGEDWEKEGKVRVRRGEENMGKGGLERRKC